MVRFHDESNLFPIKLMKKTNLKIAFIFFVAVVSSSMTCRIDALSFQSESIVLVEEHFRPETVIVEERVELKFILKNESATDTVLVGRLIVDGKDISEKEITVGGGQEGDLLFHCIFEKEGLYKVSVSIAEKGKGADKKIWEREVTVEEREIVGVELKIVGGISFYPSFPKSDEEVELNVEIKNIGNKDAKDVDVFFYVDTTQIDREIVDINAGESVTVMVVWDAVKGERLIRIVVDPKGEFGDYRFDNIRERWMTIR